MWATLLEAFINGLGVAVLVYLAATLLGPLRMRKCDRWALSLGSLSTLMFFVHGMAA